MFVSYVIRSLTSIFQSCCLLPLLEKGFHKEFQSEIRTIISHNSLHYLILMRVLKKYYGDADLFVISAQRV